MIDNDQNPPSKSWLARVRGMVNKKGWWVLPALALPILVADQVSKHIIVSTFELYESWAPIPALARVFQFHYVTNTGAAFGLFQNVNLFFIIVSFIVSTIILFYYFSLPDGKWLMRLCLGMQFSGAVGNLIDRLRVGHVIDFMEVPYWPIFNVADSMISCGVVLLVLILLHEEWQGQRKARVARGIEGTPD